MDVYVTPGLDQKDKSGAGGVRKRSSELCGIFLTNTFHARAVALNEGILCRGPALESGLFISALQKLNLVHSVRS